MRSFSSTGAGACRSAPARPDTSADSPLFRLQLWRNALPPTLRWLHTVNIATYLIYVVLAMLALFGAAAPAEFVRRFLTLPASPAAALTVPWTALTYGVVNAFPGFFGLISFAFGFYWLNWMGRDYEETYGSHSLLAVYVLGILGGALFGLAVGALLPLPRAFYFGLWTPVTAVLCAVATLQPDRQVGLFLLGAVSMKWIAIGFVVLSLVFSGDLTVLGAALAGFLFGRAQAAGRDPGAWAAPLFRERRSRRKKEPRPSPVSAMKSVGRRRQREAPPAGLRDVDAILD